MSENKTRTIVSRPPTDVITGPQTPRRIYNRDSDHDKEACVTDRRYLLTMKPALNITPLSAIPPIDRYVIILGGNKKGSILR
jgi:hypothetical protein